MPSAGKSKTLQAYIRHDQRTWKKEKRKVILEIEFIVELRRKLTFFPGEFSAMKDSMLKEFGHFNPKFVRIISYVAMPTYVPGTKRLADMLCRKSSHVKCWPLYVHKPLPNWSNGRIILIGDAAHAVCQHLASLSADKFLIDQPDAPI